MLLILSEIRRMDFKDHNRVPIIFFFCVLVPVISDSILLTTNGPLRGVTTPFDDVVAFLGVPYAEPPIGELRFAKPLPKKQWQGVYNASKIPPPCSQISLEPYYFMPDVTNMSEDCLYLNIWVPKSKHKISRLKPIIIFIHGGLFYSGSTNLKVYNGLKLAKQADLIVVTINYRVGIFGYFLAYIEEANGNMGMYDQVMAIKWIKDNAKNFGGDPDNIVLMGESAGAFSIAAHLVSPLSQNLFKRAIMESGSIIVPIFDDENIRLFRNSKTVASIVGCTNETTSLEKDARTVVDCLKSKPKEDLVTAEKTLLQSTAVTFFPRVYDEFLPQSARKLFLEGKFRKDVDVLLGINRDEGTMMLTVMLSDFFGYYGKNNIQSISKRKASFLSQTLVTTIGQANASEIVKGYMKLVREPSSMSYTKMIADIVGDFAIACGTKFNAELLSLHGNNVYFYNFEFKSHSTPMAEWIGVTHMDELQYVFGNPFHDNFTAEEVELSTYLMRRWSAFARTGNPDIPCHLPWPHYSCQNPLYLNFGQEEETIRMNPIERCDIWRKRFKVDIGSLKI